MNCCSKRIKNRKTDCKFSNSAKSKIVKNKTALIKYGFLFLTSALVVNCSLIDTAKKSMSGTTNTSGDSNTAQSNGKKVESADASPCVNRYNPVSDGRIKSYKMSSGGKDVKFVQKYTLGEAKFFEEFTVGGTTVKHFWECTDEGLIAANPGSLMNSGNMQLEPKHISGVTLPKDSEIKVGKTWSTVYQATGKSAVGDIDSTVTINNKVVALDDEIKVPAGTYKAVKIETVVNVDMKLNGKKFPTPPIKTFVWFAPEVGMVKNGVAGGQLGGSMMEYSGDK